MSTDRHLPPLTGLQNGRNSGLKSGCKAEESKLRTADRLANLISVFCILSWRIFWLTMINRCVPDGPAGLALTETEIKLLDHLVKDAPRTA